MIRVLYLTSGDVDVANLIAAKLEGGGFVVARSEDGDWSKALSGCDLYDLVLIGEALEDMTPGDALRRIRNGGITLPVAMIGHWDAKDAVLLYDGGADDVLRLPIEGIEIPARLSAVARRARGVVSSAIRIGDRLVVDHVEHEALVDGRPIHLTSHEFSILEILALRKGETITKEGLMSRMYREGDEPEIKIVDVFVCKVRRKLADAGLPDHIQTVWGRGYKITDTPCAGARAVSVKPAKDPADSVKGLVLRALIKDAETYTRLLGLVNKSRPQIVAAANALRKEGLVENIGSEARPKIELTAAGVQWLRLHGAWPQVPDSHVQQIENANV